ncbi:MAG TPA: helix-hairpin-helix domain-containing protein, partial [Rubrobacteraceae bacterium]|nr:helix-hairpin-helix domain-containing protein [Rubrobacteraceae bacterium]
HLREAEARAEEIGLPGELWQIRSDLGELYKRSGNEEWAGRAFSRAAETLRTLADQIDDQILRADFLEAPQVRYVLEW